MKKISIILGSALVMLTAGCTVDKTQDIDFGGKKHTVTFGIDLDETRTHLGDAAVENGQTYYPVLWSEGDAIAANGVASQALAEDSEYIGTRSAKFTVSGVDEAAVYNIIYPASLVSSTKYDEVTISENQTYKYGTFAEGSAIMVGQANSTTIETKLVLTNLYGFVKVVINKHSTVQQTAQSVVLHSNNLEAITGTFKVDYVEGTIDPIAGMDFVRVTANDGIAYDEDGTAVVVIAVPAGHYSGFTVDVETTNRYRMSGRYQPSSGVDIVAGTILKLPELTLNATSPITEILTADDLVAFLANPNADSWKDAKTGEVNLGADIDLTGITINPAASFSGVFNGNGYKIKNWTTSNGAGLFTELTAGAVVKNLVIDNTCSMNNLAGGGERTYLVNTNKGTISGCTNLADITYPGGETATNDPFRVAPIAVYSSGLIKDCVNEGNISVTINKDSHSSYQYLSGIVVEVNNDGEEDKTTDAVVSCINKGNISFKINDIDTVPGYGFIAGIVAATAAEGTSVKDTFVEKYYKYGRIVDCENYGNLTYQFSKTGNGTYANIGGIIGYSQADIHNCNNYGTITYTTPTSGTAGVTRPAVGGVVGCAFFGASNCNNNGSINVTGLFAAGSGGFTYSGGCEWPMFGGVIGNAGPHIKDKNRGNYDCNISCCNNYGELNLNIQMLAVNNTAIGVGGVVGFSTKSVSNCNSNSNAKLTLESTISQVYAGGVVGVMRDTYPITDCNNNGLVDITMTTITEQETSKDYRSGRGFIGGVIGRAYGDVQNCDNNGEFKFTGGVKKYIDSGKETDGYVYCGGVIGYVGDAINISYSDNTAPVTASATSSTNLYFGGVIGNITGEANVSTCNNSGDVTANNTSSTTQHIGGVIGYYNKSTSNQILDCDNSGIIFANNATGNNVRMGGVVGITKAAIKDCNNDGLVKTEACNAALNIGGVTGRNDNTVENCTNSKQVSAISISNSSAYAGGISGCTNGDSATTFTGCTNTAKIYANVGKLVCLGGIIGNVTNKVSEVSNCNNSGVVHLYNVGDDASDGTYSYAGGIMGKFNDDSTDNVCITTNCTNTGKVQSETKHNVCIGGITGMGRGTIENCTNGTKSKACTSTANTIVIKNAKGDSATKKACAGGLVGFNGAIITDCNNYATINNTSTNANVAVGGIIGLVGATTRTYSGIEIKCEIKSTGGTAALILGGQQNNTHDTTFGTAAKPIKILNGTKLKETTVTAATLNTNTNLFGAIESANEGHLIYTVGTTIKFQ